MDVASYITLTRNLTFWGMFSMHCMGESGQDSQLDGKGRKVSEI